MQTSIDYPRVRAQHTCPTCHREKTTGLLVCWTCYHALHLRDGLPQFVADILQDTEQDTTPQE